MQMIPAPPMLQRPAVQRALLLAAAGLLVAAVFLPLWGMTLVSVQYPEGLRMIVYPTYITGDIAEINLLNKAIGMQPISNAFFLELRVLPAALIAIALLCVVGAFVRRAWWSLLTLSAMAVLGGYGLWSMQRRLWQFGNDLSPTAPMTVEPFTPPMLGANQIAQFATYSYFSWGTTLPLLAGLLLIVVLWAQLFRGSTESGARKTRAKSVSELQPARS
jgi:copper chaperone NosL